VIAITFRGFLGVVVVIPLPGVDGCVWDEEPSWPTSGHRIRIYNVGPLPR